MFGHTLLRLDPKDQQQLNLVSYAVNYAATVAGNDNWSYAWKGLAGQYRVNTHLCLTIVR